jgi:hypothetical protein
MHHSESAIAADLELSERLGLEILELGAGEPGTAQKPARAWCTWVRKVNLLTGESSQELMSVPV